MSKKSEREKKAALARLAAGEVAALMNRAVEMTRDQDLAKAIAVLQKQFGKDMLPDKNAEALVGQLIKHLRECELNINFKGNEFFSDSSLAPKYTTKYETMRQFGAPMGDTRNTAEALMFHYGTGAGVDTATASKELAAASARVKSTAELDSADFVGSIRPKYCTLNFPCLVDGMGAQWGKSHFVLAEHLKPNMTFIHSDSFDVAAGGRILVDGKMVKTTPALVNGQLATYHNMTRLLGNMSDGLLDAVVDSTSGIWGKQQTFADFAAKYKLGSTSYIEGHIHAEIYFNRDVKKVRIYTPDLGVGGSTGTIAKRIAKFSRKFSIPVEYFS
jgi:hypothetical protein